MLTRLTPDQPRHTLIHPNPHPETLPDASATNPSNPRTSPIHIEDLPELEDEEATSTNSQPPSVSGSKELRADDPEGEINSKRAKSAKSGNNSKTTT